jgi:hypothetical protein
MGFFNFIKNNRDEKFGRNLGAMAITLCGDELIKESITKLGLSEDEIERFDFGLSIINIIIGVWMVNFFVTDISRAKLIIDEMRNFYLKSFEGSAFSSKDIMIRNVIVYETEFIMLNAIEQKLHGYALNRDTKTNYHCLLQMVYPIRQMEYVNILNEEAIIMMDGPSKHPGKIPMSLLAHKLASHLTGNEENSPILLVLLSTILFNNVGAFLECCTKYFST